MSEILVIYDIAHLAEENLRDSKNLPLKGFSAKNDVAKYSLFDRPIKPIAEEYFSERFKDDFVKNYLMHIEELSGQYGDRRWWGSWIRSKNRFNNFYFDHLYELSQLLYILKHETSVALAYFDPKEPCLPDLKRYCIKHGIKISFIGYPKRDYHWKRIVRYFSRKLRNAKRELRFFVKVIMIKWIFRKINVINRLNKGCHVIRNNVYHDCCQPNGSYRDIYFGSLRHHLAHRGKNILIVGNILDDFKKSIRQMRNIKDDMLLPEEYFLSPKGMIKAGLLSASGKALSLKFVMMNNIEVTTIWNLAWKIEQNHSLFHFFCHYEIAVRICRMLDVECLYITHENNPWERMYIMAFKKYSPQTQIIGYHHSVTTPAHLCFMMQYAGQESQPLPDKVMVPGETTQKYLTKDCGYPSEKVVIGCGLKQERVFLSRRDTLLKKKIQIQHILVGLEGVPESAELMNIVYKTFLERNGQEIRFREHPALPISCLKDDLCFSLDAAPNHFHSSKNRELTQDFKWADMLVYSGSGICLEALWYGIPVVHVSLGQILNVDPCFQMSDLKGVAKSGEELREWIEKFELYTADEIKQKTQAAQIFVRKYYYPVNEENLNRFIPSVNGDSYVQAKQ